MNRAPGIYVAITKDLAFMLSSSEGEEKEGKHKKVFKETMSKNFPSLGEDINLYIQEVK